MGNRRSRKSSAQKINVVAFFGRNLLRVALHKGIGERNFAGCGTAAFHSYRALGASAGEAEARLIDGLARKCEGVIVGLEIFEVQSEIEVVRVCQSRSGWRRRRGWAGRVG